MKLGGFNNDVFPTPVGMDQYQEKFFSRQSRFPHTRGDGPVRLENEVRRAEFSPHPWGWTEQITMDMDAKIVFPTPVGMDRLTLLLVRWY